MKAVIAVPHGTPIEIWFADEARVGQQGTLTRIWARRGSRPRAPRDRSYISAYLFGAVCPDRRTGAAVAMPEVNTEAMEEHLAEISRRVLQGIATTTGSGFFRSRSSCPAWSRGLRSHARKAGHRNRKFEQLRSSR